MTTELKMIIAAGATTFVLTFLVVIWAGGSL